MSETVTCPSCDRPLRVPDDLLGHQVKCPACASTFTANAAGPAPRDDPEPDRPRRRSDHFARRDEDEPRPRRAAARRDDYEDEDEDRPRRGGRGVSRRNLAPHRGGMILGLGIASLFFMPLVLGPIAWLMGNADLKEIRAGRMDPEGESQTNTGRICGMISTLLGAVVMVGCCSIYLIFVAAAASHGAVR